MFEWKFARENLHRVMAGLPSGRTIGHVVWYIMKFDSGALVFGVDRRRVRGNETEVTLVTVLEQRRERYERLSASHGVESGFEAFYDAVDIATDSLPVAMESPVRGWFAGVVELALESMGNPENSALDHLRDSVSEPAALADYQYLTMATTIAWVFAGASPKALPASGEAAAREAITTLLQQLADTGTNAATAILPVETALTGDCLPGRVARQLVDAGARELPEGTTRADMGQLLAAWLPIGYHRATADQPGEAQLPLQVLVSVAEEVAGLAESAPQHHLPAVAAALERAARHLPGRDATDEGRLHATTSRIYRACGHSMLAQQTAQKRARLRRMFGA